jgi:predicted AAA+ superfamily ATPase
MTITGPRQSGKTTLCRSLFHDHPYSNLENPDTRSFAHEDPRGYLAQFPDGAVIDEIQRAPELLSYLQTQIDEQKRNGLYVLTGSQQLGVSQAVSQSLAGRTALLRLLPFSLAEAKQLSTMNTMESILFTGFYPRIHDQRIPPTQALADYFETYVERDLRQLSELRNLSTFQRFVRLCAGRVGQLLNTQSLGNETGVTHTTAREWLSLLEASYIVFLLRPYHGNLSKRLIKSPKLYFYDVGLAAYLLGIEREGQLETHPLRGNLYENCVVMEALKYRYNMGRTSNINFYRDSSGHEVDLIYNMAQHPVPIEIKAGQTIAQDFFKGLNHFQKLVSPQPHSPVLVYGGNEAYLRNDIRVTGIHHFVETLSEIESNA